MRVVANWFLSDMLSESRNHDLSGITKIISPYHIAVLTQKPKLNEVEYLICNQVSDTALSFISTNKRGISSIISSLVHHNKNADVHFNYFNVNNIINNKEKPRLDLVLDNLKSVEFNYKEHYFTERLKDLKISLKEDVLFKKKRQKKNTAIKNGSYSLKSLLNKVKETHSPDIFSILNAAKFVKKIETFTINTEQDSNFLKIQEQFHLDSTFAKHLSIASVADVFVVDNEEEHSHYSHILRAIDSGTEVVLKTEFINWLYNFKKSLPSTPIDLVKQFLSIIKHYKWEEINEELFTVRLTKNFLGIFNYARLVKNKSGKTQLHLRNNKGGLSQSETRFITNYFTQFLGESKKESIWQIRNLSLSLNPEDEYQLIVEFN